MTLLTEWFLSGWIGLIAMGILWIETALVSALSAVPRQRFMMLLPNALSGTLLLAAVNAALLQWSILWVALALGLSLVAHLADLIGRLAFYKS